MNFATRFDNFMLPLLVLAGLLLAVRGWLGDHPQHDPWAPLDLNDPPGWATQRKLASLRSEPEECRAVLARSNVAFEVLPPAGEGECARPDRVVLTAAPLTPARAPSTCPLAAGVELWLEQSVQPAAEELVGSAVARIEHYGIFSCRRIYGSRAGNWSEHSTGNAIDIAAFVLDDGRRVTVLGGWNGGEDEAAFLRRVRDEACRIFGTVLSPDYNAAHADHFHLDQAARGFGGVCR